LDTSKWILKFWSNKWTVMNMLFWFCFVILIPSICGQCAGWWSRMEPWDPHKILF
jgi:hypothetical protein